MFFFCTAGRLSLRPVLRSVSQGSWDLSLSNIANPEISRADMLRAKPRLDLYPEYKELQMLVYKKRYKVLESKGQTPLTCINIICQTLSSTSSLPSSFSPSPHNQNEEESQPEMSSIHVLHRSSGTLCIYIQCISNVNIQGVLVKFHLEVATPHSETFLEYCSEASVLQ